MKQIFMQNRHSCISTVKRWKANLGDRKKKILYFLEVGIKQVLVFVNFKKKNLELRINFFLWFDCFPFILYCYYNRFHQLNLLANPLLDGIIYLNKYKLNQFYWSLELYLVYTRASSEQDISIKKHTQLRLLQHNTKMLTTNIRSWKYSR